LEKLGYIENGTLTEKGEFTSKIYSEEILTGELFATRFYSDLSEYQILLLLGIIVMEDNDKIEFYTKYINSDVKELRKKIRRNDFLSKEQKFSYLYDITAILYPLYENNDFFEILQNTNLSEGDLIRYFRQVLDRINQIKKATLDMRLLEILKDIQARINGLLRDFDVI